MKKVIHFTVANAAGGITKFVLRLWNQIDKTKYHFDFVTMSKELDFASELEKQGCNIFYLSTYAEDNKEQFISEVRDILSRGYDIVHLHTGWWRGFVLEEISKEMQIPKVIIHSHNTGVHVRNGQSVESAESQHFDNLKLLTEDMATDYVACSKDAARWLFGDRISEEKIDIVPYAIELDKYVFQNETRISYRKEFGVEDDEILIGNVARFEHQKNHEFLVRSFAKAIEKNPKLKLMLVGIGSLEGRIREQIRKFGIENKVIFTGKRYDVNNLMMAMDLFALPSRFEGFGIVLIEAQAADLLCVATEGLPEETAITNNISYLPLQEELWADYFASVQPKNRESRYDEFVEKHFDIESHVKCIEEIYDR